MTVTAGRTMTRLAGGLLAIVVTVALAGCNESPAPSQPPGPRGVVSVSKVSGDDQSGVGGEPLAQPFVVALRAPGGGPVTGVDVEWTITSGEGGSLSARRTTTDSEGRTQVTATLPNLEDATLTVEAASVEGGATATFSATVTRTQSGATALQKVSGDGQAGQPGQPVANPYVVRVVDGAGGAVSGAQVRFSIQAGDGGSLSASTVTTGDNGRASVTATLPDARDATQSVDATMASLRDTVTFSSSTSGAASVTKVSGDDQSGVAGQPLAEPFVVALQAPGGGPATGVDVDWTITSDEGGSLSARRTTTDSEGRTQVTATLPNLEDATLTVRASQVGGSATATFSATVTRTQSGAAALQKVSGDGQTGQPGQSLADPYVVRVVDDAGGAVSGAQVRFSIRSGDGGSLSASTVTSGDNGRASVTATLPTASNATQTVRATMASLRDTLTFRSSTTGGAAIAKVSGDGQTGVGGEPLAEPFVVRVEGPGGGAIQNETVEWTITSAEGGSLSARQTTTDSEGRTQVTATLPNLEDATLTVDASPAGGSATATFSATVTRTRSGATTLQKVSGDGQTGQPGQTLADPYVVRVVDDAGAVVPGVDVNFSIRAGDGGSLSASTVTTGADGEAAVTATLPDAANATQSVLATMASLRDTLTFRSSTTGAASVVKVSGDNQAGVGGEPLAEPFVVRVEGPNGGPIQNEAVDWTITSAEGGSLSARRTTTDSEGRTQVTATLPNLEDATLTVDASPAGGSATATFSATVARTQSGASALQKVSGDGQTGQAGQPLAEPYVVRVLDEGGGPVAGADVRFSIQAGDGGSLSASTVTTGADGEASVTATLPDASNVSQSVDATMASLRDTLTFTSTTRSGPGGPVAIDVVSGDGQKGIAGDTLADPLTVEVTDAQGRIVEGATVRWEVLSPNGGSVRDATVRTGPRGRASTEWALVGTTPGATVDAAAWIEPSDAPPDTAFFSADVTGEPATIVVVQGAIEQDDNATTAPETVVGDTVTVSPGFWSRKAFKAVVEDSGGRTVSGVELRWTVTDGGGGVGDEPEGGGSESVLVNTARDGSITVWRKAPSGATIGTWIGATLSLERFPGVDPVTLDAFVR